MNYRAVVVFGQATLVSDDAEKTRALQAMTDHLVRGRWEDIRHPSIEELKRTLVLRIAIEDASAKIRVGPPLDDEEDYALDCWAGVVPLALVAKTPVPDPRLPESIKAPAYATDYSGPGAAATERLRN